jgi:hypothetical protein
MRKPPIVIDAAWLRQRLERSFGTLRQKIIISTRSNR